MKVSDILTLFAVSSAFALAFIVSISILNNTSIHDYLVSISNHDQEISSLLASFIIYSSSALLAILASIKICDLTKRHESKKSQKIHRNRNQRNRYNCRQCCFK